MVLAVLKGCSAPVWRPVVGPGTPSMEEETVGQQISWPDKTALWDPRQAKRLSLGAVPYEGGSKASQQISIAQELKKLC